jgi:hypothetical protein
MRHALAVALAVLAGCGSPAPAGKSPSNSRERDPAGVHEPSALDSEVACRLEGTLSVTVHAGPDGPGLARAYDAEGTVVVSVGPSPALSVSVARDGFALRGYAGADDLVPGLGKTRWIGAAGLQVGHPLSVVHAEPGRVAAKPRDLDDGGFDVAGPTWIACDDLAPQGHPPEETIDGQPSEELWSALGLTIPREQRRLPANTEAGLRSGPDGPVAARVRTSDFERTAWVLEQSGSALRVAFSIAGGVVAGWIDETVLVVSAPGKDEEEVWGGLWGTEIGDSSARAKTRCWVSEATPLYARAGDGVWHRLGSVVPAARFFMQSTDRGVAVIEPAVTQLGPAKGAEWRLEVGARVQCDDASRP